MSYCKQIRPNISKKQQGWQLANIPGRNDNMSAEHGMGDIIAT